jgi:CheY-like chemotaxis protein
VPTVRECERAADPADILLVEDNPGDIRLTREAFTESHIANGLHVVTDGVEAMEFMEQRGEHADAPRPDVVLLDLNLPRKNGEEVLAAMQDGDSDLSQIPVIVLTSSEAEEDIVKSYEQQANAYLTKPVDPAEFIETVRRFKAFWLEVVRLPPDEAER